MHATTVGHGTNDHKGRSYKIQVMKIGCIITRMKRHVRATPISGGRLPQEGDVENQQTVSIQ